MNKNSLYSENLMLFSRFWPREALKLENLECAHYSFCRTEKGELNLKRIDGTQEMYYHSNQGALEEAAEWLNRNGPLGIKILYIFGIGLGYYYDVLKEWLKADPTRYLIFMEDDLCVIRMFLDTERASQILRDSQVIVHYFKTPGERGWGSFRSSFSVYFSAFSIYNYQISALNVYAEKRNLLWSMIYNQIKINMLESQFAINDILDYTDSLSLNFYSNVTAIPEMYDSKPFIQEFKNIPVLICGAGPSIGSQIDLIKKLKNRAIIFASGSALNVLNKQGIMPHFAACLDPDSTQESRFLTNYAFELPFFYHTRFYAPAAKNIHGPRIIVTDIGGVLGGQWFFKELGLNILPDMVGGGVSTTNFCHGIASLLGCNPVVFAGLDLAYTKAKRYAEGVTAHPTDDRKHHEGIELKVKQTIPTSAEGVETKWDWVMEASSITQTSQMHPEIRVINATAEGMKVMEIPSLDLKDVIEQDMNRSYDLIGWIHTVLQQSEEKISKETLLKVLETWSASIVKCKACAVEILELLVPIRENHLKKGHPVPENIPGKVALLQTELEEEIAYKEVFRAYNMYFENLAKPELNKLSLYPEQFDESKKRLWLLHKEIGRFEFLGRYILIHDSVFHDVLKEFKERPEVKTQKATQPKAPADDVYGVDNGRLMIKDAELEISIDEPFESPATTKMHYPDGSIKGEMNYCGGKLHGPSLYYHQDGTLLAHSWFYNDHRVGKSWLYYHGGNVCAILKHKEDEMHGKQYYYYKTGSVKSIIGYKDGLLDGETRLFFPDGKLKRTLNFKSGKLHGKEELWNDQGVQLIDAEYRENVPVGISKAWFDNGQLAKEIHFYSGSNDYDMTFWDRTGKLLSKKTSLPQNPLDTILKQSKELKDILDQTTDKLKKLGFEDL